MLRDFTSLRRNSGKNEELENMPVNPTDSMLTRTYSEPLRAPLNSIQDPAPYSKPDQEGGARSKIDRTPVKPKGKGGEATLPFRTPDKHGARFSAKNRFGWAQRNESGSIADEGKADVGNYSTQVSRGNGYFANVATPQTSRAVGRATSSYSETNSTQSTPTKSVTKPQNSGFRNKLDGNVSVRPGNFTALYKGVPFHTGTPTVINTVEVPHFDLKEDSSFWMEHNVQVLIRVRPLNTMERTSHSYNRCLKQESAQCITWIGQPETRFTFDHVACETVDQEMMFRMAGLPMVENCLSGYNSCMFAYGQTGSGKTYTMLGEIEDLEVKPSSYRGMTPRIFEFLFARIQAEEESRRDENLKYNCKCSFLEIYNEQISDLLDPSSSNLLLREDVKKGVYVENLSEFDVQTVNDILKLLKQGSLNRKVAATNMNRESSRSHSVFTCEIESRWEKDSMTNLRFARLNLVDLAGSERQKTSGAEGDRLKEAASINKSLSTLGHVIMVLVDVAHGKPKHVPYRDSRLTFLLQDSLGGNSKTMIIANVSPSICCAAETLNTLKFAQRAKLIQNNAIVNEDSTGDVIALQHQIQLLKEELSILKHQKVSRSLSFGLATIQDTTQSHKTSCVENMYEIDNQLTGDICGTTSKEFVRMSTEQFKSLETTLAGALRREMMAEASIKQLEAEIEQLNRLVRQREEDTRCTKMMLRFREEKIQRMETLLGGSIPAETYLLEENKALSEEIQLLQAKIDRNPEVTRFARENIRLSDQLRRFQDFYEEGEREVLISEVSKLRDQLLQGLCGNSELHNHSNTIMQPLKNSVDELEECQRNLKTCLEENEKLSGEIENLRSMMSSYVSAQTVPENSVEFRKVFEDGLDKNMGECEHLIVYSEEEILNLHLELDIVKILLKEQRSSRGELEERILCLSRDFELATEELDVLRKQAEDQNSELIESKSVIKALESQQIFSINEIEELNNNNSHYLQLLNSQESEIQVLKKEISMKELRDHSTSGSDNQTYHAYPFQIKLTRMQDSLEKAKRLNKWYQSDREFHESSEQEMDEVRRQAEAETAEVIVQMQEELAIVEKQVHDNQLKEVEMKQKLIHLGSKLEQMEEKLCLLTKDNERLCVDIEKKDNELKTMDEEWEILTKEMEEILSDGCGAFMDATDQLDTISHSFPEKRIWISEQVHKITRAVCEKELLVDELRRYLEDANNKRCDMESMLKSLRGAAMVIGEAHQQESSEKDKEILQLISQVNEKTSCISELENKIKLAEERIEKASVCSTAAFVIVNRFSDLNHSNDHALKLKDMELNKLIEMNLSKEIICDHQASAIKETEKEMESLKDQLAELERNCSQLERSLSEEREHALLMELKIQDIENSNISMTKEKLAKFESGVFTLKSSMASMRHYGGLEEDNSQEYKNVEQADSEAQPENNIELNYVKHKRTRMFGCSPKKGEGVHSYSCNEKNVKGSSNVNDKEITIILLKKEIESALESLQEVQAEMTKAHVEKKEMLLNEKQSQEKVRYLASKAMSLQSTMNNFERHFEIKIDAFNNRLQQFEHALEETRFHWSRVKEAVELEVGDGKMLAAQKTAEASCILAKFEEAQNTIVEADMMIKGLIIANETLKVDVERLNEERIVLINDRNTLRQEVHSLQRSNDLMGQQIQSIEQHASSNAEETKALIMDLGNVIKEVEFNISDNFTSLAYDLQSTKSLLNDSMKLVHSCLENIWFEIISKDCAVSVLHLCHLGILVETVTGLNAEKSLLQYGMCKSNSIIAELSDHNVKSKRELDMCGALKGKLLADLKKSFDRIQRKEEEAGYLNMKLVNFEKKISDLQFQEELMLQRSNNMGSQLAVLIKDLNLSNTDAMNSLLIYEKKLKNKEELESQNEFFVKEWCLKDFDVHVVLAEMDAMTIEKADMDRENRVYQAIFEQLKKDLVLSKVDTELREELLEENKLEVLLLQGELQEAVVEKQNLLSNLELSSLRITGMHALNKDLEQDVQSLKDEVDRENRVYQAIFEKLKKDLVLSKVDTELREELLEENKLEVLLLQGELQEAVVEKQNLLSNLELSSLRITEMHALNKALEQDVQSLKDEVCSNDGLRVELNEITEMKVRLLNQVELLEAEYRNLQKDKETKEEDLQREIWMLESATIKFQSLLDAKDAELCKLSCLEKEKESLKCELRDSATQNSVLLQHLETGKSDSESSLARVHACNQRLQDEVSSFQTCLSKLERDLEIKSAELLELQSSQSAIMASVSSANRLKEENDCLKNEVESYKKSHQEFLKNSCLNIMKSIDSVEMKSCYGIEKCRTTILDKIPQEMFVNVDRLSKFIEEFEGLEFHAKEVIHENLTLQDEVSSFKTCISKLERDLEIKSSELLELQSSQSAIMASVSSANGLKEENDCLKNEVESYKKSHQEFLKISCLNIMKGIDSVEMKSCYGIEKCKTTILDEISQEMFVNVDRLSKFIVEFEGLEFHTKEVIHENLTLQADLLRKDEVLKGLLFDLSLLQETASNNKDKKDEFDEIVASMEALDDELAVKSTQLDEAISHGHILEAELLQKKHVVTALELDISNERESVKFLSYQIMDLRANLDNVLEEKSAIEQELTDRKNIIEDMEIELLEMRNALGEMNNLVDSMANSLNQVGNERDTLQVEMLCLKEKLEITEARAAEFEGNLLEAQQTSESRKIYAEEKIAEVKLLERSVEELDCTINVLENKVDIIKEEAERQRLQREELELELHSVKYKMQNFEDADTNMKRDLDEKERKLQEALKRYTIIEQDTAEKNSEIAKLKAHISELNLHAESQSHECKQKYRALESMAEQVRAEGHSTHVANSLSIKSEKHPTKPRGSGSPFKCIGLGLAQQMKSEKDEELTAAKLHIEELESLAINRQKEIFTLNSRLAAAESMTHDVIRDLLGLKLNMLNCASLLDNQQVQKIAETSRHNDLENEEKEQDVVMLKKQINDFMEDRRGWLEEIDRKQTETISVQVALEKLKQRYQLLKTENEMLKMESVNYKTRMTELEEQVKKLSGQQNLQQRIHHHAKIKEENNILRVQNEDLTAKLHHTEVRFSRVKEELSRFRATFGGAPHDDFDEEQHALKFKSKVSNERIRQSQLMQQSSSANSRTDDHLQSPKLDHRAPYFSVLDR